MKISIVFLVLALGFIGSALYLATDTRANIAPAPPKDTHRAKQGGAGDFRGAEKVDNTSAGDATSDDDIAQQLKNLEHELQGDTTRAEQFSIENAMTNQEFALTPLQKQVRDSPAIARIKSVQVAQGFVVLDAGLDQNLREGINLAVRRDDYHIIAKLIVGSAVEPSESIANIAPNTIPTGVELRPGDAIIPWANIVALKK
ncbi:MAG: hypothetical protein O3C21_18980 [Verrucomicrobia bacterium]|nr:hypothetical protein [Verrucomicrobiota bacterium]